MPDDAQIFLQSGWEIWPGVELMHSAHTMREFEMHSNAHTIFVRVGRSSRYEVKSGKHARTHQIFPDTVTLLAAGNTYSAEANEGLQQNIGLKFAPGALEGMIGRSTLELRDRFGQQDPRVSETLKLLLNDLEAGLPFGVNFGEGLIQNLASHLARNYAETGLPRSTGGALGTRSIGLVLEYIRENLDRPLRLEELANLVGYSPFHFHRQFRVATGTSLHQYIVEVWLERACQLLRLPSLSIVEVAIEVGFSSPSHLGRLFRRKYGVSPTEYRASLGVQQD